MNNRAITLHKTGIITFLALLTVATLAPYAGNQYITGTIVNCVLLVTTATLGIRAGLLICIIPGAIALAVGLLPLILAPMIPFVMLGNTAFIIVFYYLKDTNYWIGAVSGAVLKFGLLCGAVSIITGLVISENIDTDIADMMTWPQLVTTFAGSLAAFGILFLRRK
jgi:hypothetical protein